MRVTKPHMRTYTTYAVVVAPFLLPLANNRLARSRSPMNVKIDVVVDLKMWQGEAW